MSLINFYRLNFTGSTIKFIGCVNDGSGILFSRPGARKKI